MVPSSCLSLQELVVSGRIGGQNFTQNHKIEGLMTLIVSDSNMGDRHAGKPVAHLEVAKLS
jgi:hypothetical protein